MNAKETLKLNDLNKRLDMAKSSYENVLPIFHVVHRKKLSLELDIKILEDAKMDLMQGQLIFEEFKSLPTP